MAQDTPAYGFQALDGRWYLYKLKYYLSTANGLSGPFDAYSTVDPDEILNEPQHTRRVGDFIKLDKVRVRADLLAYYEKTIVPIDEHRARDIR